MWKRNIKSNWFREIKYSKESQIKRDTKIISNYAEVSISSIRELINQMFTKGVNTSRWLNL